MTALNNVATCDVDVPAAVEEVHIPSGIVSSPPPRTTPVKVAIQSKPVNTERNTGETYKSFLERILSRFHSFYSNSVIILLALIFVQSKDGFACWQNNRTLLGLCCTRRKLSANRKENSNEVHLKLFGLTGLRLHSWY